MWTSPNTWPSSLKFMVLCWYIFPLVPMCLMFRGPQGLIKMVPRLRIWREVSTIFTLCSHTSASVLWPNETWRWGGRPNRGWRESSRSESSSFVCPCSLPWCLPPAYNVSIACIQCEFHEQIWSNPEKLRLGYQLLGRCRPRPVWQTIHHRPLRYAVPNECRWYCCLSCTAIWYI
jgi:hypothetical protein